jgi:hypothetical protein
MVARGSSIGGTGAGTSSDRAGNDASRPSAIAGQAGARGSTIMGSSAISSTGGAAGSTGGAIGGAGAAVRASIAVLGARSGTRHSHAIAPTARTVATREAGARIACILHTRPSEREVKSGQARP